MEIPVIKFGGGSAGAVEIPDSFAARKYNGALVHQVVCANFANAREGNRAQKTRAEVSHTTRKLFRQKGSGRARGGMSSSPIRRGGGRAFPSRPDENFKQKIPRRMFRAAMAVVFSQMLRENRIAVVDVLAMDAPKTREFAKHLTAMKISGRPILLVDTEIDEKVALSARNLPYVRYCPLNALLPADLGADKIVITGRAVKLCAEYCCRTERTAPKLGKEKEDAALALIKAESGKLSSAEIAGKIGDEDSTFSPTCKMLAKLQKRGEICPAKLAGKTVWFFGKIKS